MNGLCWLDFISNAYLVQPNVMHVIIKFVRHFHFAYFFQVDIFIDYSRDEAMDEKADNGEKLMFARKFVDEKWSAGR